MPEHPLRPLQSPAKGRVTRQGDPGLTRIVMIRYDAFMARGHGPGDYFVGIPPEPGSPEVKTSKWSFHRRSEVAVLPPVSFRIGDLGEDDRRASVVGEQIVNEHVNFSISHVNGQMSWSDPVGDPFETWNPMNWPEEAAALLAPDRLIHGWSPDWDRVTPTTILGRPGTRVPLDRAIPFSDPRAHGDEDLPYWFENYSDAAEVVIDDEHGVILEWNGLGCVW